MNKLGILCFSKNRPTQLKIFLKSIKDQFIGDYSIHVIYWADSEFEANYNKLSKEYPNVQFHSEQMYGFNRLLSSIIQNFKINGYNFINFGTDDVFYYRPVDLNLVFGKFIQYNISAFSLRLGKNIEFCQPANRVNKVPDCEPDSEGVVCIGLNEGDGDFTYYGEVGMTIYRTDALIQFIYTIANQTPLTPNRLESFFAGNMMNFMLPFAHHPHIAFYAQNRGSVITVNRVQEEFQNATYAEVSTSDLNKIFDTVELDTDWYAAQTFKSIHIGDWKLKETNDNAKGSDQPEQAPAGT